MISDPCQISSDYLDILNRYKEYSITINTLRITLDCIRFDCNAVRHTTYTQHFCTSGMVVYNKTIEINCSRFSFTCEIRTLNRRMNVHCLV